MFSITHQHQRLLIDEHQIFYSHSGPEHADQDQRPRNRAEDEEQGEEGESGEGEEGEENEERLQDDRPGAVEENSSLQALDDFDSEDGEEGEESGEEESEEEGEEEEEEEGEDDDDHGYNLKGYEKDERGGKKIITLDAPDDSITYQRKLRLRFIGRLSHAEPKHTHADSLARKHRIIPRGNLHLRSLGSKGLADEHKRRLNQRKRTGSRIGG